MKKIFKKLAGLMMGLLVIGGLAGIGAETKSVNTPVVAEAADITAGTVLYLKPNGNWKADNARFAAYFFGNGEEWVDMEVCKHDSNVYKVTSPNKKYKNVIFCRMNPNASANNWNNRWNQTGNLAYNSPNNLYTVEEGTWDKGGGTWSNFTPQACFTIKGGHSYYLDVNEWSADNARFEAYVFGCNDIEHKWTNMTLVPNCVGNDIYTFVVPDGEWCGINFVRMNPSKPEHEWDSKWTQSDDIYNLNHADKNILVLDFGKDSSKLVGTWLSYTTPNCTALMDGLIKTNTCAKPGVDETTISGSEAIAKFTSKVEELRALYEGLCADEKKYIETQKIDGVTYLERLQFLELKAAHLKTANETSVNILSNISSNNNIAIILIIGLLGLATIGGYYYLNKKKYAK